MAKTPSEQSQTVGEILEKEIAARGLTAYRISQLIGAHTNSVRKALNKDGSKMTIALFRGICAALQISPCDVLDKLRPVELLEVPERGRGRPKKESGHDETSHGEKMKMPVRKAKNHSSDDTRK